MDNYTEIEVDVFKNISISKDTIKYSFSKRAIDYYRVFTDNTATIKTMLFLQGNPKGLILDCGYETFKKKLGYNTIDLSSLTQEQKEQVFILLESFQKK